MHSIKNYLLIAFAALTTLNVSAQKSLTEAIIKMEITEVGSDDDQVAAQLEMMKGTETDYYFNGQKSMVKANMMGGMMEITTITDNATEDMTMYMNMMGNKMMIPSTKAERDTQMKDSSGDLEWTVTYDKADTKSIAGYQCHKATIASKDNQMTFNTYVTEAIKADNKMIQGLQDVVLEGFPLEYTMVMPDMSFTHTTKEIITKLEKDSFEISDKGYKKLTFTEFIEQMGAMGGGMGF